MTKTQKITVFALFLALFAAPDLQAQNTAENHLPHIKIHRENDSPAGEMFVSICPGTGQEMKLPSSGISVHFSLEKIEGDVVGIGVVFLADITSSERVNLKPFLEKQTSYTLSLFAEGFEPYCITFNIDKD